MHQAVFVIESHSERDRFPHELVKDENVVLKASNRDDLQHGDVGDEGVKQGLSLLLVVESEEGVSLAYRHVAVVRRVREVDSRGLEKKGAEDFN